jgi:uncharacterized protein GlcG (DUF336 family)
MPTLAFSGISTPGANTKTANLATGTFQFIPKGTVVTLVGKESAAGINATLLVGGVPICNDQQIIFIGTSGTSSVKDNIVASAPTNGGQIELYLRNTTGTAGTTCDYAVYLN